jgi:hypothetical protein
MYCQDEYMKRGADYKDRFLFTGDSCFPLSPSKKPSKKGEDAQLISKND